MAPATASPTTTGSMNSGSLTNRSPTPPTMARPTQITHGIWFMAARGCGGGGAVRFAGLAGPGRARCSWDRRWVVWAAPVEAAGVREG